MNLFRNSASHQLCLRRQAEALFTFYQRASINPRGGFYELDENGKPQSQVRQLHASSRMVHCFAIGQLLGRPGAAEVVDHGLNFIWKMHRDTHHGGYVWSLNDDGVADGNKQAYGHAFVLLAASSAKCVGHPLADKVMADVSEVLEQNFWESSVGAQKEEFARDWSPISSYRGQNSNMHLTEALMAAFEATGDATYLRKAESISELIINRHARALGWRVAEHFDAAWNVDLTYLGSAVFRPAGTTPGHWLEWSRLLLQLWELGGRKLSWLQESSTALFKNAIDLGWDHEKGGFFYTLDWQNKPMMRQRLWWPATEGIGAAAFLAAHDGSAFHEYWYKQIWDFCDARFIDHVRGGWLMAIGDDMKPVPGVQQGKPDIYHALQACLIPLYPAHGSLTKMIQESV